MSAVEVVQSIFFYIIAVIAVLSAIGVIFAPKIIYSALSLVVTFISIAGIYILLNADFVGISQIMVYGVGVTIVMIFAIMFTSQKNEEKTWIAFAPRTFFALIFSFLLFLSISFAVTNGFTKPSDKFKAFKIEKPAVVTVEKLKAEGTAGIIGQKLFTKYVLPFEVLSLLLLAVILGAVVLARKDGEQLKNPTTQLDKEITL